MQRFAFCCVMLLSAKGLSAQEILSGAVIERTSKATVAGVVVSAIDSSGRMVTRAVTDLANGYRVMLPAGVAKFQFRRIGFIRLERPISDTARGRLDVAMERLPTTLPPLRTTRQKQCESRKDQDKALALWEEARSGLLTSIVARETKAAWISMLLYAFQRDGAKELPRRVARVELASSPNGFVAAGDPQSLLANGYMDVRSNGAGFLGPDEVVLSDDSFLATHCFSLAPLQKGDDSTVGVRFQPGKQRKVVEIDGTLWLRKNPMELKSVEYKYVNVDRAQERANVGGSIRFRTMPNGISMIEGWTIRSAAARFSPDSLRRQGPVLDDPTRLKAPAGSAATRALLDELITVPTETGALIELLQWPGAVPYIAPLATVHGTVRDPETKQVVPDAVVTFANTPYRAKADSLGMFSISDVLPGTYDVYTDDPALDPYGASAAFPPPREVRLGDNDFGDVPGETPEALVRENCKLNVMGRLATPKLGKAALFGLVRDGGSHDIRMEIHPDSSTSGSAAPLVFRGKTDPYGRFRACGLPTPSRVSVTVDENATLMGSGEATFGVGTFFQLLPVDLRSKPPLE